MWFFESIKENISIQEIIINFMPSWWYRNYNISYGKKMIFDCDYRIEADQEMRRIFYERFGKLIGAGESDPKPRVVLPDWDNTYFQTMLGFDTIYCEDQYPMAHGCLTDEAAMELRVPENIWDVYPFTELASQIRQMSRRFNIDIPLWMRTRGILNEGIQICGSDFYGELLDEDYDEKTEHVFNFILGVIEKQLLSNKKYDPNSNHIMMNCTAAIAGARTYEQHVLPYDMKLYDFCHENSIPVGLHHCGKFDDFINVYQGMKDLFFLEIGYSSQIRPVLEKYRFAQVQYIVDTTFMREASVSEVEKFGESVKESVKGHEKRFHLSIPDLEYGTPDENILALVNVFQK